MKELIKRIIWSTTTHRPSGLPNILLVSSRRSGSTWLMETIAAARGVRYIDQPFTARRRHESRRVQLPATRNGHLLSTTGESLNITERILEDLITGRLQINSAWDFRKRTFHRRTDRLVIKLLAAKHLVPWMDKRFGVQVVFSIRHPIPTALSCLRNEFRQTADAYLFDDAFRSLHLTHPLAARAERILREDDALAKYVLGWVLENLTVIRELDSRPNWLFLPYESFVLHTEALVRLLAERLDLEGVDDMLVQAGLPSRSTHALESTLTETVAGAERLAKWRRHVDADDEKRLLDIPHMFDIDLYRIGSDVAHHERDLANAM